MLTSTRWRILASRLTAVGRLVSSVAGGLAFAWGLGLGLIGQPAAAQQMGLRPIIHKIEGANERMEMIVNTSRILTLGSKIPRAQVNNPDVLELTALSATQIQVMAKKPGVTQVNLWDEDDNVHSLDVLVIADAQELALLLRSQFPKAALRVTPLAQSVVISGYVDDPNQVDQIIEMAQDYHPKVINNITVGGVQQVLLQIKVMEVSRTKLRNVGVDWGTFSNQSGAVQSVSGLLQTFTQGMTASGGGAAGAAATGLATPTMNLIPSSAETMAFVINGGSQFFGILNLLQQRNVAKVVAEPQLVTVSGRPAQFNVGGEFPIMVPQSLGTISIQYRKFGTQVDFVPIVLGNGAIRLEVRPRISEIDPSRSITINGTTVPGLTMREVDTGAEMRAGQTLAIAGLVQVRQDSQFRGTLWLADLPLLGMPFRALSDQLNEIETLIMITPQLVDAMDPHEVPPGGPGHFSTLPTDRQFAFKGHLEVPNCDPRGIIPPYPNAPAYPAGTPAEVLPPGSAEPTPPGDVAPPPNPEPSATPEVRQDSSARGRAMRLPSFSSRRQGVARGTPVDAGYNPSKAKKPSTRNSQTAPAVQGAGNSAPGFIGPMGYDVR